MGLFDGTPLQRPVLCDQCGQDVTACVCPPKELRPVPAEKLQLRIRVERRKRGKIVSVVSGLECPASQRAELLKTLKQICGAGGSVDATQIEIQGDHHARIQAHLLELGYKVR